MAWLRQYGNYLFWVVLVVHLAFIGNQPGWAAPLTKLSLMPILLLLFYAHTQEQPLQKAHRWVYVAFVAAYLGDILLVKDGTLFFLGGMLSFMLTHVCYSLFFLGLHPLKGGPSLPMALTLLGLGAFSVGTYVFLSPYIASDLIQKGILVYMCLIGFMAGSAAQVMSHSTYAPLARLYFLPGALSFVVSDAVLATNLFFFHQPLLGKLVMLTYGFAQWRLLQGFLRFFAQKKA